MNMVIKNNNKILGVLVVLFVASLNGVQARRKKSDTPLKEVQKQEKLFTLSGEPFSESDPSYESQKEFHPVSSPNSPLDKAHHEAEIVSNEQASPSFEAVEKNGVKNELSPENTSENKDSEEKAEIYLNFENTELTNFINYIAELKTINIIPDKNMSGIKISLTIRKPLTVNGAWNVFQTILDMAGFAIIKAGDVYKIVQKAQKIRQPLDVYINVPLETLPNNDSTIRYVTFLNNINVNDVNDLLANMLGQPHLIIPQPQVNGFIITAKSHDIKSAMKVIRELDQTGLQESVVVISLQQANAKEVKELFDGLIAKNTEHPLAKLLGRQSENTTSYFSPTTRILADERMNKLILLGSAQSIEKIEKFIKEHIDTELKEVKSPLRIYELQHTDAEQIAEILSDVTNSHNLDTEYGQTAAKFGNVRGGVKYFKNMKFKVDKEANRLIASCADDIDWELLKKTIQDLDKAQPQVAIETLIVQVSLEDDQKIGSQLRNKKSGMLGKNIDFQSANLAPIVASETTPNTLLGNMLKAVSGSIGQTILSFGKSSQSGGVWGALQILKSLTNTTILSQPFITVANKATATISVGQTKRIPSQFAVSETGTIATNAATGFESKPVHTKVDITPQINIEGIIKLDIDLTLSDFLTDSGNTTENHLKTHAMVANGQVLVLGGFVKTQVSDAESKTPILGDIPLLGWLFKSKTRSVMKNYIFVFMCPVIIKPRTLPGMNLYTKMKLHDATNEIESAIETKFTKDPIHNWFFNSSKENFSHKVVDYANARYQPTTVDISNDPYYRSLLPKDKNASSSSAHSKIDFQIEQQRKKLKDLLAKNTIDAAEKKEGSNLSKKAQSVEALTAIKAEKQFSLQKDRVTSLKESFKESIAPPQAPKDQQQITAGALI